MSLSPGAPPAPVRLPGKIFLRKNFHPFSGAHYPHRSSPLKESTERVKIFPQKNFALEVGLGREELQGILPFCVY